MQQRILGKSGIKVSAIGLGCMGMSEFYGKTDDQASLSTLRVAYDSGVTLFDTADMYGKGHNETLVGKGLKPIRDKVVIATKCGIVRGDNPTARNLNGGKAYIKASCEASLKRLGIETIDLYYLHRVDPNTPIEESMQAMAELRQAGKIRAVGLSEADAATIRRADKVVPLAAVQSEFSIMVRHVAEAVLPTCKELNIAFVPYSPLARGVLSGDIKSIQRLDANDWRRTLPFMQDENLEHNLKLVAAIAKIAEQHHKTPAQIALAWLLAQGEQIVPIPGSRKLSNLQANIEAATIRLTSQNLADIKTICDTIGVKGQRMSEASLKAFNLKN